MSFAPPVRANLTAAYDGDGSDLPPPPPHQPLSLYEVEVFVPITPDLPPIRALPAPAPARDDEYSMLSYRDDYNDEYEYDSDDLMSTDDEDALPEEMIAGFLKYASCKNVAADDEEDCHVCLDHLHRQDRSTVILPGCRHAFHSDCIGKWLREKNVCPLCRAIATNLGVH